MALYPLIHRLAPDTVLTPLAMDTDRGWLLIPDGGTHLGDVAEGEDLVEAMAAVLPRYAELQRSVAPEAETFVDIGVADMRPAMMPQRFEEALAVTGAYASRSGTPEHQMMWEQVAGATRSRCGAINWQPRRYLPVSTTMSCTRGTSWCGTATHLSKPASTTGATA